MNWTELLKSEVETACGTVARLIDKVDADRLDWKPGDGSNWMTTGQLLLHLGGSCGIPCKGFVRGDWGMPEGADITELPPAGKLPTVASVGEARRLLAEDRALALQMIDEAGEQDLASKMIAAPWNPNAPRCLGQQLLSMIEHMLIHKAQLFYYLKLQGKPVSTVDLWS